MILVLAQTDQTEQTIEELSRLTAADWAVAGVIVVVSAVLGALARGLVIRNLTRRTGRLVAHMVGRLALGLFVAIGVVYALNQVGVSMGPLLGLLGLLGLALALALQDVLSNFIAGVMLSIRRPFRVGDQIGTADFEGVVEDVSLRSVTMRTFDGVRVLIPNSTVWDAPIENFTTLGARRSRIDVGVGYQTDLDEAIVMMADLVADVDGVLDEPPPAALVDEFGESAISIAVFFWHGPAVAVELDVRDRVARELKRGLDTAGIEIPFPQVVVHARETR